MPTHTPGPWTVARGNRVRNDDDEPIRFIQTRRHAFDVVAPPTVSDEQHSVDAALVAAAPDLLAALRKVLAHRREMWGDDIVNGQMSLVVDEDALDAADAAIAKAVR